MLRQVPWLVSCLGSTWDFPPLVSPLPIGAGHPPGRLPGPGIPPATEPIQTRAALQPARDFQLPESPKPTAEANRRTRTAGLRDQPGRLVRRVGSGCCRSEHQNPTQPRTAHDLCRPTRAIRLSSTRGPVFRLAHRHKQGRDFRQVFPIDLPLASRARPSPAVRDSATIGGSELDRSDFVPAVWVTVAYQIPRVNPFVESFSGAGWV